MTTFSRRLFTTVTALLFISIGAHVANAQYYTSYYSPYTAYYTPYTSYYTPYTSYYTPSTSYYSPYNTYYGGGGWYPGYWMNRIRTRLWGSTGYVAGYPATYSAGYAPSYYASYAPSTCSSCQANYMTSYAPSCPTCSSCSTCASCAPCSSCSTCASYAPACPCESCPSCESCSGCSACSAQAPVQAGYAPSSGCSSCGNQQQTNYPPQGAYASQPAGTAAGSPIITTPGTTVIQQNAVPASATTEQRPGLESGSNVPQSTYRSNRPSDTTPPQQPTPQPAAEDPYKVPPTTKTTDSSTYLEAPKLWDPRDRTAQRNIAPVHTALYKQPASFRPISTTVNRGPVTAKQVEENAIGWTNVSN